MTKVIGLHGLPGSGKDSVAEHLICNHGYRRLAFADALKRELRQAFDVPMLMFNDREIKTSMRIELMLSKCRERAFVEWWKNDERVNQIDGVPLHHFEFFARTPRQLMQRWGDWRKFTLGTNYWVHQLMAVVYNGTPYDKVVISDVRFNNEAAVLLNEFSQPGSMASIIEVTRENNPYYSGVDQHNSNQRIKESFIEGVIRNNGSLAELGARTDTMMSLLKFS